MHPQMYPQLQIQEAPLLSSQQGPVRQASSGSFREAQHRLCGMFEESKPFALLHSDGQAGATYLIDKFLAGIADDVIFVRLSEPCRDEESGMRQIISGLGFDPTGLSPLDVENVFALFLNFQKKNGSRTILCFEAIQGCGSWVLDTVRRLLSWEAAEHYGLMILMAGRSHPNALLNQSVLDAVSTKPQDCIYLAPFTLQETREFLRWQVESTGKARITQVLEFDAITRMHEVAEGEPDAVSALFSKCLRLAAEMDPAPVAVDLVNQAHIEIELPPTASVEQDEMNTFIVDQIEPRGGRLVVRLGNGVVQEHSLDRGHVLIGRGKLCDVRIASPSVSRHHALVVSSPTGVVLIDLESTNDTLVDDKPIKEHVLDASGTIIIGDCSIDFVGEDEHQGLILKLHSAKHAEQYDDNYVTQNLDLNEDELEGAAIKGSINSKGDKIYHVPGTSKYAATKIDESKGERWFADESAAKASGWRAPRSLG